MAQLDYVNIRDIGIHVGVNLSEAVGIGAPNLPQDVAVVQALFRIIAKAMGQEKIGLHTKLPLPVITGQYDGATHVALMSFQSQFRSRLLSGRNSDSRFHPASYQGRVIKHPRKPLMAITLLHILAKFGDWNHMGGYDYVEDLQFRLSTLWGRLPLPKYPRPSAVAGALGGS